MGRQERDAELMAERAASDRHQAIVGGKATTLKEQAEFHSSRAAALTHAARAADVAISGGGGGGARGLWSAAPGASTTQGRVKDAVGEIAAMADAALRLKPSPNSAAVWKPEGDGDGLTEVEATEPPPPRVTDTYQAASTTPVVAAAIRAAELAARQSQKEVEAAALEQANRDWEGGRK